jgi:hypothetical protein
MRVSLKSVGPVILAFLNYNLHAPPRVCQFRRLRVFRMFRHNKEVTGGWTKKGDEVLMVPTF